MFFRGHGIGRLTRDPESRTVGESTVCKVGLAFSKRKKNAPVDPATGFPVQETYFLDADIWNGLGETVQKYAKKGDRISVEGELRQDSWADKTSGELRTKFALTVTFVELVEPAKERAQPAAPGR